MNVYIIKTDDYSKHLSDVLFPLVFEKESGKKISYKDLKRGRYGKPQPVNGIHFNISHSLDRWCIAFSDTECGIDIEINRGLNARLGRKILHEGEQPIDGNLMKNWVIKEAYSKLLGIGIRIGFKNIDLNGIKKQYVVTDLSDDEYICYAVGNKKVKKVSRLVWDGTKLKISD